MKVEDRPTTLLAFISHIERYGDAFAELHMLGVIAIPLPVSTASCERSFSALRHIKIWMKTRCLTRNLTACLWLGNGEGAYLIIIIIINIIIIIIFLFISFRPHRSIYKNIHRTLN